jgi:hypothetical protein
MHEVYQFKAVIEDAGGGGAYVRIPFDVEQAFGEKRVKVQSTIDGEPYRGLLVRMGMDCHVLIVLKEIRLKIGKPFGEEVEITIRRDTEPRVVSVTADVQRMLDQNPEALTAFRKLS